MRTTGRIRRGGFTLIELMIVVSVIAILSAVLIPKYGELIRRADEASTLAGLGAVRSAINIYYAVGDGMYPEENFADALVPRYMDAIPQCWTRAHGASWDVTEYAAVMTDVSGWGYWTSDLPVGHGPRRFFVSCTHRDNAGKVWSTR